MLINVLFIMTLIMTFIMAFIIAFIQTCAAHGGSETWRRAPYARRQPLFARDSAKIFVKVFANVFAEVFMEVFTDIWPP